MNDNSLAGGLRKESTKEIELVVEAMRQKLGKGLVAAVLFGSRARGEAREESDWDLLVIARDLPMRQMDRYRMVKELLPHEWRGRISILAKTPEEFEAVLPPLYLEIAMDGLIVYDPEGYAGYQLLRLRRLIQAKGLKRERQGDDLVWQWKAFPGFGWSLAWAEAV
jgi:predicted nucleotidyltransferase